MSKQNTAEANGAKPARSSSNPRWESVQALFHAYYADGSDENRNRLFTALHREIPQLARLIARKRAGHGVGAATPTQIGEEMSAKFWNKRGITQLAGQYNPEKGSFYTWASTVLNNEFGDWLDNNRIHSASEEFSEENPAHAAFWQRQKGMETHLYTQQVGAALTSLDPQLQQLLDLRLEKGLTVEETARLLGVSPATVKRRQKEAYQQLRATLGERGA